MPFLQKTKNTGHQNVSLKEYPLDGEVKKGNLHRFFHILPFVAAFLAVLISITDVAFLYNSALRAIFNLYYNGVLLIGILSLSTRYLQHQKVIRKITALMDLLLLTALLLGLLYNAWSAVSLSLQPAHGFMTLFLMVSFLIREFFHLRMQVNYRRLGPAQLFVISFLSTALLGSFLLMLPDATTGSISYVDALFTATSAVCVTGLNVLDTELSFTLLGQSIILLLIQVGGLGIMTFTTYFSYFFKGASSYKNQLLVKDITNDERLDNVFSSLKSILLITVVIEGLGFALVFLSLDIKDISLPERAFFSLFHAISGFCNAGFSTLSGNLYDMRIRFNYPVHIIISSLIILGGLGFPIIHNLWEYTTTNIRNLFKRVFRDEKYTYSSMVLNVNSHIVLITTALLLIIGTLGFYIFERNGVLTGYSSYAGKWTAAFFGSVTTRTAGFNSTDTAALSVPTSLIFIVLMWIGASPASTGGGIKTSTFALAFMNFMALIRGKKPEYRGREISQLSISRAFAQMTLASLFIMVTTFTMIIIEPEKEPLNLLFETVSAYGTVGLSRNVTPLLSDAGKLVITFTMFVGRVSLYTLLYSLIKQVKYSKYRYPTEEILIN